MKLPRTLLPSLASLLLTSAAHAGTAYPAPKGVEAAVAPAPDATSTVLGLGLNTNDNMTEGSAFLVQPLWDNVGQHGTMGGSLLFAEPYFTWGEEGELSGSLGLGFRHLFSNEPVGGGSRVTGLLAEGLFVGANVFADYKHTKASSDLWQLGIGVEAGVRYLEVRANYYLPLHDGDNVGSFNATEFTPTTVGGRPALRATTRTLDIIEEPMEGWDAELALLIPGLDKYFDMRLVGGYYSFETNTSGHALAYSSDVEGWKAGVEVRPVPAVVLAGMWYEDENLVEDNWMVSVRLEVPLGKPGSESFVPRRRHLQERLLEPVHRQNAAIQTGVSIETSRVKSTTTLTTAQQAQRFLSDLNGWGAVYTGASKPSESGSPSSSSTTGALLVLSNTSGSSTSTLSGGSGLQKADGPGASVVSALSTAGSLTINAAPPPESSSQGSTFTQRADGSAFGAALLLSNSVNTFAANNGIYVPPSSGSSLQLVNTSSTNGLTLTVGSGSTLSVMPAGSGTLTFTGSTLTGTRAVLLDNRMLTLGNELIFISGSSSNLVIQGSTSTQTQP